MIEFFEKANQSVIDECRNFIKNNGEAKGNYYVYKDAIKLYTKLSTSLMESHKPFDDAIKDDLNIIAVSDGPRCYFLEDEFNKKKYTLYLDVEAHKILDELFKIIESR